jgi:hypothetical protein
LWDYSYPMFEPQMVGHWGSLICWWRETLSALELLSKMWASTTIYAWTAFTSGTVKFPQLQFGQTGWYHRWILAFVFTRGCLPQREWSISKLLSFTSNKWVHDTFTSI